MDQIELDLTRRTAGAEYLAALRGLGLRPDALFWGHDRVEDRFVLMLVTEMVDFKGPLVVMDLLFQAHSASATPKEIDPFVVRLHSPEHALIQQFDGFKNLSRATVTPPPGSGRPTSDITVKGVTLGDVESRPEHKSVDLSRRWRQFAHNVERLAA